MNRFLIVLLFGLCGGLAAHSAWYAWRTPENHELADAQYAWMKDSLKLTDEQYAVIKGLHEKSSPHLQTLADQVRKMRTELEAYEQERRATGQVDFVEFARFADMRRNVDAECAASTRQLIADASRVMTPAQRQQYLALVSASAAPLPN